MDLILYILFHAIIACFIGWITNWLVVKLLFHPRKPLFGLPWAQGLIPSKKDDLINKVSEAIGQKLIKPDMVYKTIAEKAIPPDDTFMGTLISNFAQNLAGEISNSSNGTDFEDIIKRELNKLDIVQLEGLLLSVIDRELKWIIRLGGILGFVVGSISGACAYFVFM